MAIAMAMAGCAQYAQVADQQAALAAAETPSQVAMVASRAIPEAPYTLDSGDKLRVVVFGQEGLTQFLRGRRRRQHHRCR